MRVLLPVLFFAVTVLAEDPHVVPPATQVPDKLNIPARLSKTIDTRKCKPGDKVEMKSLGAVLIANGLVMPENAKLHGRIVNAASRQDDKPSWVLLVVERAEWKEHTIALHAFITSQITTEAKIAGENDSAFENAINLPDTLHRRRSRSQTNPSSDLAVSATHPPRDATVQTTEAQQLSYHGVDDLRIVQDKNGRVFLLSQKPHLKLPSGTMFMLCNHAAVASIPTAAP
jgi:hypothetical protein